MTRTLIPRMRRRIPFVQSPRPAWRSSRLLVFCAGQIAIRRRGHSTRPASTSNRPGTSCPIRFSAIGSSTMASARSVFRLPMSSSWTVAPPNISNTVSWSSKRTVRSPGCKTGKDLLDRAARRSDCRRRTPHALRPYGPGDSWIGRMSSKPIRPVRNLALQSIPRSASILGAMGWRRIAGRANQRRHTGMAHVAHAMVRIRTNRSRLRRRSLAEVGLELARHLGCADRSGRPRHLAAVRSGALRHLRG